MRRRNTGPGAIAAVAVAAGLILAACGSNGTSTTADSTVDGSVSTDAAGEDSGGGSGGPTMLPQPTGTCPNFVEGDITVNPASINSRDVRVWVASNPTGDGPLVFYWHGTGSSPNEAAFGLGATTIDEIKALGGMVAAPYHDPAAGNYPWFLTSQSGDGGRDDDLRVADEVLACAIQNVGIDTAHIHSIGMSAGGLQTTQMSFRRSGYLASVVTYSGGLFSASVYPTSQDSANLFAALIIHGGPTDEVVISFMDASENYWTVLNTGGQFAAICNHGGGHSIPTDARPSVWLFFQDHPWDTVPSPYAQGLPGSFPNYCSLSP